MTEDSTPTFNGERFQKYLRMARPFFMALGVGLLLLLIYKVGWSKFFAIISHMSPGYVILAVAALVINLMMAAHRFRSLAAPHLNYSRVFEVVLVSYLLNYASMIQGVGIGAKVGLLKGEKVAVARSLAGTGAEVIFDLIFTVMAALAFALYFGFANTGINRIHPWPFIVGAALGTTALTVIYFVGRRGGFWGRFLEGLKEAMAPRRFFQNFIYTAVIWLSAGVSLYFIILATGARLNPLFCVAALAVGFVVGLISLVPGGLGVRDFTWAYVCSLGGVPLQTTGTAAIFMRFIYLATVALILIAWGIARRSRERKAE